MAVDLDAARVARREQQNEGPVVIFGGKSYSLAPELPYGVLESMQNVHKEDHGPEALVGVARSLLGEHYEAFKALDPPPSIDDLNDLIGGVMEEYGVGNSPASS